MSSPLDRSISSSEELQKLLETEPMTLETFLENQEEEGCWGRNFKDWTQYLICTATCCLVGGALGGTVGSMYGIKTATANGLIATGTIAGAGGGGVAFWKIRNLKKYEKLSARIQQLIKLNETFRVNLKQLNEINTQLVATKNELNESLSVVNTQKTNIQILLDQKAAELQTINLRLEQTVDKLNHVNELYTKLKAVVENIAKNLHGINQQNHNLKNQLEPYSEESDKIDKAGNVLSREVKELSDESSEFTHQNEEYERITQQITKEIELLNKGFFDINELIKGLKARTDELDETDDKLLDGANKIDAALPRLENILKQLKTIIKTD